tara:strand:+ start:1160 stop:1768 length:609 start_codon:yes stop_codon:yes gene_type:complete
MKKYYLLSLSFWVLAGCTENFSLVNYNELSAYSKNNNLQMVVEIPAGINKKFEYNYLKKVFEVEIVNNEERIIDFLPYLGNYGYVPSTLVNSNNNGDGDALDILLISQSLETGDIVEILPIAILSLMDGNKIDNKIIAIPLEKTKRIIDCNSYEELSTRYPDIMTLIKIWFTSYKGNNIVEFKGWGDQDQAMSEINRYLIKT